MTKSSYISTLQKLGLFGLGCRVGIINPKILRDKEIFDYVHYMECSGVKHSAAVSMGASKFDVSTQHVYSILRDFK